MAKSCVALSLNEKVRVIEAKDKDKLSVREIMKRFKCGRTQVYNVLKQKNKIMNEWLQGNGRMKRKVKVTRKEVSVGVVHECKIKKYSHI
jgi:transposase